MIIINVAPGLIERGLRTGNVVQQCRVNAGLPEGAQLMACHYDVPHGWVVLQFRDPEPGPDRQIDILVQTWYHNIPSEVTT